MDQETLHGQAGAYRIYESIASGGFGSVFIGRDISTNVPVAVKRLHAHLKDEPGFVERFEQEASTVRGLAHPNIVRLLDQGRDASGVPFIVMEWVEGLTIGDWLKRRGTYTPTDAAEVGCQVLEGLDAAWARRVVHRDIKPANLMVTPSGRVKIMDFGVAKDVELATLAGSSGIIGTPAYMAPEQLRGKPLDCRADLYALGVTLQLMLTGRPPFEGPSFADYFRQHLEEEPPPVVATGVDNGLAAVVHRALAKAPEDRFGSPGEMLTALRPYADERTLPKAEPHASETVRAPLAPLAPLAPKRRVPPWAIAAPLIGVAVVAVGVALLVTQPRAAAPNQVAASVGTSSAVVTTPQSDGTLFSNPLTTDAQAAVLRKTASPSAYLIGRAPDNTYAIQKLLGDNSPPG
ncbi:MAG TPA: serine/threonine-protein kinase, partial [Chloroflexota bacterium]